MRANGKSQNVNGKSSEKRYPSYFPFAKKGSVLRRSLRLVTIAWVFGSVWVTATAGAPLTLFAKGLGASRFEFGLLAALPFLASLLALAGTILVERIGRRRFIFLISEYTQRLIWFPIGLLPLWMIHHWGNGAAHAALLTFLILIFLMNCGGAVGSVAWTSWMADIVPGRLNGKYFSRRRQWGIASAIPTAIFVGWVLDHHVSPTDQPAVMAACALLFVCSAVFGTADIATFHFVPDVYRPPTSDGGIIKALIEPLRNRDFLCAVGFVAVMIFALTIMNQFVTLYLIDKVKASNTQTQFIVLIGPAIAQLLTLGVWGAAADRMGQKPLLILSGIGMVLPGLGWLLTTSSTIWMGYIAAMAGAALWTGIEIANFNLVLELSTNTGEGTKGSSSYIAVNAIVTNVAGFFGGIASGVIAQILGDWHWHPSPRFKTFDYFDILFVLSAVLRLLAVVIFLPLIQEPQARPSFETLRFMTTNVYNNVVGLALQPLRIIRRRK
jgi:MFS family permease